MKAALGAALLAWALVYLGAVAAAFARARARAREGSRAESARRVILVRPCCGAEAGLVERLAEASGAAHVVLAVGSAGDGALPAAYAACARLVAAGVSAEVLVTGASAPNRKAHQIALALERATIADFDTVAVLDSDVDARDVHLGELAAVLDGSGVAAAWRAPVHRGPGATWGDRLTAAVLSASMHAFPVLAGIDGAGMVGKCFVVDRRALEQVGGFSQLTGVLAEDMALARRLRAAGLTIACAGAPIDTAGARRTTRDAIERFARWATAIRAQRPALLATYPLFFFPSLLLPPLALAVDGSRLGAVAASVLVASRLALALVADRASGRRSPIARLLADAVLADVALAAATTLALVRRDFAWRGVPLAVGPLGQLVEPGPASLAVAAPASREARP